MGDAPKPPFLRRQTLPPEPPTGMGARLAVIEHKLLTHAERDDRLEDALGKLSEGLGTLTATVGEIHAEVRAAIERRKFWTKVLVAVTTAVALFLIGVLAKISLIVQGAKLPTP